MERDIFIILHSIFKKMKKLADKELYPFGLTSTEMRLLNMIYFYDADGCSQDEFISRIEIDRSNIGRSLKKLEKLGYIRREKNHEDKRAFKVFLTDKGQKIKNQLIAIRRNVKKTFSINIMNKDFNQLIKLLEVADSNLNEKNLEKIKKSK